MGKKGLPSSVRIFYSLGAFGEGIAYNLYNVFYMYFLISIAGVPAAAAGMISSIAVVFDAVTDPIEGSISDRFRSRYGRRIPFLLVFSIPLGLLIYLMFKNVDLAMGLKVPYLIVINALFWIMFSVVDIPYLSLGCELTDAQDEQVKLRTLATILMNLAAIVSMSGGILIVDYFTGVTSSESKGYEALGLVCGVLTALSFFTCAFFLRGREIHQPKQSEKFQLKTLFRDYRHVFGVKQIKILSVFSFLMLVISGLGSATLMFEFKVAYKLTAYEISMFSTISVIASVLFVIPAGYLGIRIGKSNAMKLVILIGIMSNLMRLILPLSFAVLTISSFGIAFMVATFWTVVYPMNYDMVDLDYFIHGKRREGLVIALNSFIIKLGTAFGLWLGGFLLSLIQFDSNAIQYSDKLIRNLMVVSEGVPLLISIFAIVFLCFYKPDKQNVEALKLALKRRECCEEYTTDGFQVLIGK